MTMKRWITVVIVISALVGMSGIADAAPSGRVAWIGSPIKGSVSSAPASHIRSYGGQWAVDLATNSAQTARVYIAVDARRDPRLSTKITEVSYACAAIPWDSAAGASKTAARRLSRGGKRVVVGVYFDGALIGRISYAHVDNGLALGTHNRPVNRWGGSVGTVGTYKNIRKPDGSSCWTGRHLHLEAGNASGRSCFWSGLTAGRARATGGYLGYVGYNSPARACPPGI